DRRQPARAVGWSRRGGPAAAGRSRSPSGRLAGAHGRDLDHPPASPRPAHPPSRPAGLAGPPAPIRLPAGARRWPFGGAGVARRRAGVGRGAGHPVGGGGKGRAERVARGGGWHGGDRGHGRIPVAPAGSAASGQHSRQSAAARRLAATGREGHRRERPPAGRRAARGARRPGERHSTPGTMRRALLLAGLSLLARALVAQTLEPAGIVSVVSTRVRSQLPSGTAQFSGAMVGGNGTLSFGRLQLAVSYVQGKVDSAGVGGPGHDLVEGSVLLGAQALPWLTLAVGPHARSYTLTSGTQRWVFWELRARAAAAFIGSAARGYVELWRALSADVNVPESFDHAQGGEAGMIIRFARAPLQARGAYRMDHTVLHGSLGG